MRVKLIDFKKVDMDFIVEVSTGGETAEKRESVEGDSSLTICTYRFRSPTARELTITKIAVEDPSGRAREVVYEPTGLIDDSS